MPFLTHKLCTDKGLADAPTSRIGLLHVFIIDFPLRQRHLTVHLQVSLYPCYCELNFTATPKRIQWSVKENNDEKLG